MKAFFCGIRLADKENFKEKDRDYRRISENVRRNEKEETGPSFGDL